MPFIAARVLHDSPKFFGKTYTSPSRVVATPWEKVGKRQIALFSAAAGG
jgi:hypothetical protein